MSIYETLKVPGVMKILISGVLLTSRNVLGLLNIRLNQETHKIRVDLTLYIEIFIFRFIMILGMIMIGYICMTKM